MEVRKHLTIPGGLNVRTTERFSLLYISCGVISDN